MGLNLNTNSSQEMDFRGETSHFNGGNKENDQDNSSTGNLHNRYKRNTPTDKSLSNYQDKYNKLEQNFRKFTQGLQEKRTVSTNANTMAPGARSTIGLARESVH